MAEIISPQTGTGISCASCDAVWTGAGRAHCSGCHVTFSTASAFDLHIRGSKHVNPKSAGLVLRSGLWGYAGERPAAAAA